MFDSGSNERGSALLLVLFFAIIVASVVAVGSLALRSHETNNKTRFQRSSQAGQFARAGLTEALSWYRRQPAQPVLTFDPQVDLAANPQIIDTIDADVGIVREFKIRGSTWGRYEVWKEWATDPDPERLAWRQQMQVADVSQPLGLGAPGSAWRIRSVGYVFRQVDGAQPFDSAPNRVIASSLLESDILRLKISPPAQAALSLRDGGSANVAVNGRVDGGATGAGIFYFDGGGAPSVSPGSVAGSPGLSSSATFADSYQDVFGVSFEELRAIADLQVTTAGDVPSPVPTNALLVVDAPAVVFDAARPLSGTGLVVVRGDVVVQAGSASLFSGFLYVDGDLRVEAPATLTGAVVVTGAFDALGAGDYATVEFDDDVLTALRIEIGQYRLSGAIRPIHTTE